MLDHDDIRSQVIAALKGNHEIAAMVEDRVYPAHLPQSALQMAAVVVNRVDAGSQRILIGYIGQSTATVQVDAYSPRADEATRLGKLCKLLLMNPDLHLGDARVQHTSLLNDFDSEDPPNDASDRWRYRRVLRFEITHCEDVSLGV